jgi:hypothetical protein
MTLYFDEYSIGVGDVVRYIYLMNEVKVRFDFDCVCVLRYVGGVLSQMKTNCSV